MLTTDVVSGIGEDALVEGFVVEDGGDDVRVVDEGSEIEKTKCNLLYDNIDIPLTCACGGLCCCWSCCGGCRSCCRCCRGCC